MGLVIGRLIRGDNNEQWKLTVLIPITISFFFGSYISIFIYKKLQKLALLINVVIFICIWLIYSIVIEQKLSVPLWRALLGWYYFVGKTGLG